MEGFSCPPTVYYSIGAEVFHTNFPITIIMIRSSQTTIKFTNINKRDVLKSFIKEYKKVVIQFVDILWKMKNEKISLLLDKNLTSKIDTWLSARAIQCAGKQASGIVRGTIIKQEKRQFVIDKLQKSGQFRKARKLQRIYDKYTSGKPEITSLEPQFDSRFIKIDFHNNKSFDGWLTLTSLGNKIKLHIPFKRTKHLNKLLKKGKIKNNIRISKKDISFCIEIEEPEKKQKGNTIGIDIGKTTTISCSNGFTSKPNKHGHDLNTIIETMSKKKKGSKGFQRCVQHRKNYINWSINQLNLKNIKQVNIENIKHIRKNKRTNRTLSHWTYTDIFDKIRSKCQEQGVLVREVSPTYTSQRCSRCGWVRKVNRKKKRFKCDKCLFEYDADLNASINISLCLPAISKAERLLHKNRVGFYWREVGQERIVPVAQET